MSEETTAETMNLNPIADASKGSGDRFEALFAGHNATVQENSPENLNNEVQTRQVKTEKQEKTETGKKDEIPDFSKKEEKTETTQISDEDALKEELKQHPSIKGEAAKSFAKIRTERETLKSELSTIKTQFEAKIKELESRGGTNPEQQKLIDGLNEKLKGYEEELGKANFSNSPRIKRFDQQASQELLAAKSYLDGDEAMQGAVELAAGLSGQKRLRALVDAGIGTEAMSVIGAHLARIDQLRGEKNSEIESWREKSAQMEQETKAQQNQREQAQKAHEQKVFDTTFDRLSKELEGYQKVDGYDDWNKTVDERTAAAKRIINGEPSLEEVMEYAIRGVNEPATRKIAANWERKYREAAAELSSLKAAAPNGGSTNAKTTTGNEGGSMASRFDSTLSNIRG